MRDYLFALRKNKWWSQKVASTAIGVSQSYYCAMERGERQQDMTYSMMEKLSKAFDVPVQTIIESETNYTAQRQNSA